MLENDLYKQFEKEGVKVLVIGREETAEKIKAFREKHKLTLAFAADPDKKVYSLFATKFIPRTYVIDRTGKLLTKPSATTRPNSSDSSPPFARPSNNQPSTNAAWSSGTKPH